MMYQTLMKQTRIPSNKGIERNVLVGETWIGWNVIGWNVISPKIGRNVLGEMWLGEMLPHQVKAFKKSD